MHILDTLKERGFIAQVTFEDDLYKQLERESTPFYVGFDPTATSLHFGHFIPIIAMAHMQRAGHIPIALVGGGTAMIGDPSGKTDMRKMMTVETIDHNVSCIKKQMERFIEFGEGKAHIVNNADWLRGLGYMEFIRDIGSLFSVNRMLAAECYKQRLERGLTFLEFNYMLMQSYDFLQLFQHYGCRLQMGGDDQWSNMLAGTELIRKKTGDDAYAMTITLLLNSEGKKMGKTAKGAVWLDPQKTSPFEFYQYWRNVEDADVMKCIKMLTFIPLEKIQEMENWEDFRINEKKEILAHELTELVHGKEEADKAQQAAHALFSGSGDSENMPTTELTSADIENNEISIVALLVKSGLCASNGEAKRLLQQGGVMVNDEQVKDIGKNFSQTDLETGLKIRKGKKHFHKIILK